MANGFRLYFAGLGQLFLVGKGLVINLKPGPDFLICLDYALTQPEIETG